MEKARADRPVHAESVRVRAYPRHNAKGQRQHTNPKARLRKWKAPGAESKIWCYRKQPGPGPQILLQPIKSATVLHDIWTEDEERRSNIEVEQPAAPGLKILTESPRPVLSGYDRQAVAGYIMSMFRRGWQELAAQPQRFRPEVVELKAMIHAAGFSPEALPALDECIEHMSRHPSGRPRPIRPASDAIAAMRWTVLRCPDRMFVTGDSPVQIVPHDIVDSECEVTLPLSPARTLVCDWGFPRPPIAVRVATGAEAFEVNRRTALGAEQYVFFADRPAENAVGDLLDGDRRPRILDVNGRRSVPPKQRRKIERIAQRSRLRSEKERLELVERLKALDESSQLVG